jgi:hypothetical protein
VAAAEWAAWAAWIFKKTLDGRAIVMMWRKKVMPLSDWAAFQWRFAEFQKMLHGRADGAVTD